MKFSKMHGLGNDYVLVDTFEEGVRDPVELAKTISDRHTGVGGDGLILIGPSVEADVRMEMYNADGSRAQMCGNGIRCVAKYVVERSVVVGTRLRVKTGAGIKSVQCEVVDRSVRSIRVDMGSPVLSANEIPTTIEAKPLEVESPAGGAVPAAVVDHPLDVAGTIYRVTCVSMGNPHAVLFIDDLESVDLEKVGPKLEHAAEFPERINAHFVRVESRTQVSVRTWERGSGMTRACGTGACAVCVAGVLTGRTDRTVTVTLPGGDLRIEWADDGHVHMAGPATFVFTGDWPA